MDIEGSVKTSSAIDTPIKPETKTPEQAKNTAAKAAVFQRSETKKEAVVEEEKNTHKAISQRSENTTVPAMKINKVETDDQENPAEMVEMASEGEEKAAPARPSSQKSPKKEEAIKSEDAEKSSEAASRMNSDQSEDDPITPVAEELYVGHLNFRTSKDSLTKHFSRFGEVVKVDLPLKCHSTKSKGYAFVTFKEASSAKKALDDPFQEIDSSQILVKKKKEILHFSSHPNLLFVGALNSCTQPYTLEQYFSKYGKVNNVSVPWKHQVGRNKGFAFVSFESAASLKSALEEEHEIDGKKIGTRDATPAGRKNSAAFGQPGGGPRRTVDNQLYVKHLSVNTSEKNVKEHFSQFGEVAEVYLPRKRLSTENEGYAIVTFKEASSAKKALAENNHEIDTETIVVQPKKRPIRKTSHPNELFVGRLDHSTRKLTLQEYFAKYGKVTKVSLPWNKQLCKNKGYAFICFKSAESLQSALAEDHEIDGRKIGVRAGQAAIEEENTADASTKTDEEEKDKDDANEV